MPVPTNSMYVVAGDLADQRAEAEAEGEQVDRRVDGRGERRRAPERREVDDLADHHAHQGGALEPVEPAARCGGGDRGHQLISSPVRRTKTSSRLVTRRSPSRSSAAPLALQDRDRGAGAPGAPAARAGDALDLGQPRRRPVDLDRLGPGVLGDQLARRADGDGLAVRHDRDLVAEALGLLDVVRAHQDRDALGAQPVDQRPQLLADLRVEADGRLVEQQQLRLVQQRAGDQQAPAHAAAELVDLRLAALGEVRDGERRGRSRPRGGRRTRGRGGRRRAGSARRSATRRGCRAGARRPSPREPAWSRSGSRYPSTSSSPSSADHLRRQGLHRRRLARAVRAEQADAGPERDVEIEAVDGGDRAEALHDAAQPDGVPFVIAR